MPTRRTQTFKLFSPECLPLRDIATEMSRCTRGHKVSVVTLIRYIKKGKNGVKLEAVKVGRDWCTTLKALDQFYRASTVAVDRQPDTAVPIPQPKKRSTGVNQVSLAAQRSNERAEELGL